jgi:hypothetical protein
MGEGRPISPGTLWAAAVVAIGGLLSACSHDPVEPAPVYMMGADRATDHHAPLLPRPGPTAGQTGRRYAMTPPAPPATRTVQPERGSQHIAIATNHSAQSHKKARGGHPAMSHATAARRAKSSATPTSATDEDASAMTIPLDDPAPERIPASSWVSPPPPERAPSEPAP